MDIITKIFDWLSDLLGKIFKAIQKIIPIILVGVAIWLALGLALPLPAWLSGMVGVSSIAAGTANALLALGASFLLAPTETGEVLSSAVSVVGDLAGDIAATAGDVVGSFLTSPGGLLLLGAGLLFLFAGRDKEPSYISPAPVVTPGGTATGGV